MVHVLTRLTVSVSSGQDGAVIAPLRPGDLIFGFGDTKTSKPIIGFQRHCGYQPDAADASHVAVYCGEGRIVHAVSPKVVEEGLLPYFAGRRVALATWDLPGSTGNRSRKATEIVSHMRRNVGQRYDSLAVVTSALAVLGRKRNVGGREAKRLRQPLVCSTLVSDAFFLAFGEGSPLFHPQITDKAGFTLPAYLFCQPGLRDP
jgi:hypothetical protein